jgi:hypothetical protein
METKVASHGGNIFERMEVAYSRREIKLSAKL